jgi:hypothetical protein
MRHEPVPRHHGHHVILRTASFAAKALNLPSTIHHRAPIFFQNSPLSPGISHEDFNPWDDRELEGDSHRRNFAFAFFGEGSHNLAVI